MSKRLDLAGQRFGRLVAIRDVGSNAHRRRLWLCRCDCGEQTVVCTNSLRKKDTKSCGCLLRESTTHGHTINGKRSRTYICWQQMLSRCRNPNDTSFSYYGGRGITVCELWFSFENFLADIGESPEGLTIERVDNDGNYSKNNCIWASQYVQQNNRRNCIFATIDGRTQTLTQWARELGIKRHMIDYLIKRKDMTPEQAIEFAVKRILD